LAHNNLGLVMLKLDRYADAEACFREAIRINPDLHRAHNNLGNALLNLWRLPEALNAYREANLCSPNESEAGSNAVFLMNYLESLSPHLVLEEARRCGESISAGVTQRFSDWTGPDGSSRIRIGFVSGDFKLHPVGYFLEGLMTHLDRSVFETFAYSASQQEDALTKKFRNLFDHWDPIFSLSDDRAASLIHGHSLQILIDLSGHTAYNRLGVFARRPAPVQVTWLGYVGTTGLPEMDWILANPHSVDEGEEWQFTEKVWRLPETTLCFTPPEADIPVGALPASRSDLITFGCFNNLAKVNDEVIQVWAKVLRSIEKSRLILKAPQLVDAHVRDRLVKAFEASGVSPDRLILEGPCSRIEYLAAYQRIDIALDTFPYPGGTTSIEGLWMGVPFVTRRGDRFVAHQGEMLARNVGLPDWIAHDSDHYVEVANHHASNLQGLNRLRTELRAKALMSPLFDAPRFARNFEQAMKSLWQQRQEKVGRLQPRAA
jgi:predicted O-linked N-acetylglucosamine transferase (SPINDLY family)